MHKNHDVLGEVIKKARERANDTLAAQVGVTERYMYRIENEGQKPSYDVLYKLIRALSIPADTIFYPEQDEVESEMGKFLRILCRYDKRFQIAAKSILRAFIDTISKL